MARRIKGFDVNFKFLWILKAVFLFIKVLGSSWVIFQSSLVYLENNGDGDGPQRGLSSPPFIGMQLIENFSRWEPNGLGARSSQWKELYKMQGIFEQRIPTPHRVGFQHHWQVSRLH